jgi:bile acid:Na+ symporter, BASS family
LKTKLFHKIFLALSAVAFLCFAILYFTEQIGITGPFLICGFIALSIAVRGFPKFKGFSYSLMILTAVTVSMYYPEYFLGVGDFQYQQLIVPLLQIIMFGMGSQMSLRDFTGVMKMPKGVLVGIICQFTIMPIMGITLASLFNFPPEIAAGIVLVGTSPSGMASNVMSFIAKANLALSITLTAFATLLSPFLTPLLMKTFAGQFIEIDFWNMMLGIFNMVILPICAGLIFNLFSNGFKTTKKNAVFQIAAYVIIIFFKNFLEFQTTEMTISALFLRLMFDVALFVLLPAFGAFLFAWFAKGDKILLDKMLSVISMAGIGIIITIITASGRDSLLEVGLLLILACFLHNMFGYSLGYGFSKLLRMNEQDCRTIALEVGMQNGGLASGLALQMGKVATVGLAPAIFGPMMNVTGSILASWWRTKPVNDKKKSQQQIQ